MNNWHAIPSVARQNIITVAYEHKYMTCWKDYVTGHWEHSTVLAVKAHHLYHTVYLGLTRREWSCTSKQILPSMLFVSFAFKWSLFSFKMTKQCTLPLPKYSRHGLNGQPTSSVTRTFWKPVYHY